MNTMKKIILTGGGTAGHVTPNIALVPQLKEAGFEIKYIGSEGGMETKLVEDAGLDYQGISSGKLRRYFSWKNFSDPFRVLKGYFQAKKIIRKFKLDIVFIGHFQVCHDLIIGPGIIFKHTLIAGYHKCKRDHDHKQ